MEHSALDWQKQIYLNGFSGHRSLVPVDFDTLEKRAQRCLSSDAFAYIAGGAGREITLRNNLRAFESRHIVPRMLRDVSERNTTVEIFGKRMPSPLLLAPVGVLELVHPDADAAVARAASVLHVPYIFSNQASVPMEACASKMGNSPRWFQLYWSKSNELVQSFIQRAERCGCEALVVTLDTTMLGWRTRDLNHAFLPFLYGKGIAQYTSDPVFFSLLSSGTSSATAKRKINLHSLMGLIEMVKNFPGGGFLNKLQSQKPVRAVQQFIATYSNAATTWEDLKWLRDQTKLPILLKGILHADDARKAIAYGMDGIIVSNHGGRQVDGAVATLDALPSIAAATKGHLPILLDSGIRSGADVFKALALGATAVCVGRPYVYGLALAGELGVYEVLRNLMAEFELTMGLAGCKSCGEIGPGQLTDFN